MRATTTFALLCCLVFGTALFGQLYWPTNTVGQKQAIKIASHLKVGMREEDAFQLLATNKLYSNLRAGDNYGWDAVYDLTDHCSLHLSYTAREWRTNWGGNGRLDSAFIQSNGVNIY